VANEKKITTVENANVVAFLTMKGFIAIPYIIAEARPGQGSRVAWDIEGDTSEAMQEFYSNKLVGVREFVKCLQEVRASMYTMKQMSGQLKQ
jgi:hypothetical protein